MSDLTKRGLTTPPSQSEVRHRLPFFTLGGRPVRLAPTVQAMCARRRTPCRSP